MLRYAGAVTGTEFLRARSPGAKRAREDAILAAATRLATEHGVREVTVTAIAETVGMHKSAILRYFETREQIFLHLAADAWHAWSLEVRSGLAEIPAASADDPRWDRTARRIAELLAGSLADRPLFCDLLAHTPLNLERNVSHDAVRSFKRQAVAEADSIGTALGTVAPLGADQARSVVTTATAMAGALWQMAAPGTRLRTFYETDPELSHSVVEVRPRLTDLLTALLAGYAGRG